MEDANDVQRVKNALLIKGMNLPVYVALYLIVSRLYVKNPNSQILRSSNGYYVMIMMLAVKKVFFWCCNPSH